jgi:uncharacterized protein (UPF0332 family)
MGLTNEERMALVDVRLEKSRDTFAEVSILIDNGLWRTAANRLYYACFYAVGALLVKDNHDAKTHNGVFSLLGQYYVKENIISEEQNDVYRKLLSLRLTGDYDDWSAIRDKM